MIYKFTKSMNAKGAKVREVTQRKNKDFYIKIEKPHGSGESIREPRAKKHYSIISNEGNTYTSRVFILNSFADLCEPLRPLR